MPADRTDSNHELTRNTNMLSRWTICLLVALHSLAPVSSAPAADEPRSVLVNVLAYSTGGGKSMGTCTPVRVTAGEASGCSVRVGFFESEVGGTGNQWRSAGWMAAVTAAVLSDFDPRTTRVSFEYEGRVDGPSAGALMTCGVLAAARGDTLREDAAMTGTINPDGSIGPVGGISHKIEGAAGKGMKLVLIPAGVRFDTDGNTGERVDLLEHGETLGVKVVPVFDIYHAYKLLSGIELPRPPVAHTPQVTLKAQQQIRGKIDTWYDRYAHSLTAFMKLKNTEANTPEIVALYQQGVDTIKHSQELIEEGEFTAALWDRVLATACGYLALETGRCTYTYSTSGYDGLAERLRDNAWLESEVTIVSERLQKETPQSLDQLSIYLIACETFLEGVSLQRLAKATLENLPEEETEESLRQAADAAQNQIIGWLDLKLAGDYLDMAEGYAGRPIPANAPWRQAGDYLRRAANANMAVFDAVIVEPAATQLSLSAAEVRNRLMQRDKSYAILRASEQYVFPELSTYFGEGDALGYAFLATSLYTHTRAAGLLAKYYSLDAELNEAGYVVGLKRERTLAEWLTFAEDQTRRNIALLQENGVDASPCAQLYGIARIKARRDVMQQMEGLVEFWAADMHSRVLRLVSGIDSGEPAAALEPAEPDAATPDAAPAAGESAPPADE